MPRQNDRRAAFRDQFAELVAASGMSIRDIQRRTGLSKSTIADWKNGKALPQDGNQLDRVARVLIAAAGDSANPQLNARALKLLLGEAKEERDADSVDRPARVAPRDPGLEAERRARAAAGAWSAKKAFMSLRNLDTMPDWQRELNIYSRKGSPEPTAEEEATAAAWNLRRDDLLGEIELAALDIDDEQLRARLREAVEMVNMWSGPMRHIRQGEQRTRWIVATDALEALGAYGRGDPLPARSAEYGNTKEFVDLYIEEWEMNSRH